MYRRRDAGTSCTAHAIERRTRKAKKEEPGREKPGRVTAGMSGDERRQRESTRKRHRRRRRCDEDEATRTEQQSATRPASAIPGEHKRGRVADEGRSIVPGKREKDERRRRSAKERTPTTSEKENAQASTRNEPVREQDATTLPVDPERGTEKNATTGSNKLLLGSQNATPAGDVRPRRNSTLIAAIHASRHVQRN